MSKNDSHIIGKISWETTCDDQSKASELQNALSRWTHEILPSILAEVFDSLNLDNETLQIQKLEIDIGCILYNELKNELDEKVPILLKNEMSLLEIDNFRKPKYNQQFMDNQLFVKTAGIVLISAYVPLLFERLKLTTENQFKSKENQLKAVNYLKFLATGLMRTEEQTSALHKICCGLDIDEPIANEIKITEDEKKLLGGLIDSVISHWSAIGESSRDGFRGNWLMRNGIVKEETDKWTLNVEKKAYDLLINKSPFSFSIIKFPWMEKPLHVNWSY